MKYTREQRLDIGCQIYSGEITFGQAMVKYDVGMSSLKEYVRLYREINGLPKLKKDKQNFQLTTIKSVEPNTLEEYEAMSKEELINALPEIIKDGDTVLVKASHSMQFEKIVEYLKENK